MAAMFRMILLILVLPVACIATAFAQVSLQVTTLAEKKASELPAGPLYWRIETFPSFAKAKAGAGSYGLAVQSEGKAWLFTLGPPGGASPGATRVSEVGPIARIVAPLYLLRINAAQGPPGSLTSVHSHPGSEAFFVISGEQRIRSAESAITVGAGQSEAGGPANAAMQVSSSGNRDLH